MTDSVKGIVLPELPDRHGVKYRHIPGFWGYAVGDDGTLWSAWRPNKKTRRATASWHQKRAWINREKYLVCSVKGDDGKERRLFVHTLVLLTFVGPRPGGHECCHGNGDPSDNRLSNLRWGTRGENMEDCRRHGKLAIGERNGAAKLSNVKVEAAKILRAAGRKII
jgi:hypothetical protein